MKSNIQNIFVSAISNRVQCAAARSLLNNSKVEHFP